VAEHGEISVSDVSRLVGMNWHTSKKLLMRLHVAGILEHGIRTKRGLERDTKARFVLRRPKL
jgi:Mn-dependent DtxR family transcriptional regulator